MDLKSITLEPEDQESSEDEQEEIDSLGVELSDYIEEAEEPISESTVSKREEEDPRVMDWGLLTRGGASADHGEPQFRHGGLAKPCAIYL